MSNQGKYYRNYLFDLYGTLVDIHTEEDSPELWKRLSVLLALEGAEYTPEELRKKYRNGVSQMEAEARSRRGEGAEMDLAPLFRSFYTTRGIPADDERTARLALVFRILSLYKLRLFPGTMEMLRTLHDAGRRVYLLSNAQKLFTRPELQALGLETCFDGIILSSEAGLKKPDAGLYRLILERYGLDPRETVMVGNDDIADCHGAAAAGMDSLYVQTAQSPEKTGPLPKNCRQLADITGVTETL